MTASPDVMIRPADAADAQPIGAVFDAAVLHGWTYLEGIEDLVPMFPPEHWDEFLAGTTRPDSIHVAQAADDVVGYTATKAPSPEDPALGELYLLFVHPDAAGLGIGRTLLSTSHAALREAGAERVFLFTHERNLRARSVYRAAGYVEDGVVREEEFRGRLLTEVRMVADLS
ncbi:hypothetical protein GCM10009821_02940 [Aeromicrobium halocynthiae]|uniref:N-acetyltransferase domain-containing protein n=1 Tax=Aeromicrobium halocynthiae TaxID=560557 RepID=A0ABP5HDR1_9ACTN